MNLTHGSPSHIQRLPTNPWHPDGCITEHLSSIPRQNPGLRQNLGAGLPDSGTQLNIRRLFEVSDCFQCHAISGFQVVESCVLSCVGSKAQSEPENPEALN